MSVSFEWDARKAASNLRKHEVSFEEAMRVFGDPLARIFDDPEHSESERRELIIGHSTPRRLLIVSFVERAVRFAFSVQGVRRDAREETMKKVPRKTKQRGDEGMRPEYRLDYAEARQNRFAGRVPTDVVAVVLDPDVTRVFASSDSVNTLLRSVIRAMPTGGKPRRKAG